MEIVAERRRFPESTYRLQFHKGFTFADATAITPYLAELGITHAYASPYLKATAGSTHGYDVIDHHHLNPEVGTEAEFDAWVTSLRERGMSHILDTVPNHVGVATNDNAWWNDVLENGRASRYAGYFDIAWDGSPRTQLHGKVLLPLLGDLYGNVLEKGELKLSFEDGKLAVNYYQRRFPISPATVPAGIEQNLVAFNGAPGDASSFDQLDGLLSMQAYRLAYWRVASDEINYRRFFDINDLAALCMERLDVFQDTHALILKLLAEGKLAGLRIDHPDGLYDPKQYFLRLQRYYILATARELFTQANGADEDRWNQTRDQFLQRIAEQENSSDWPLYVVAEKILAPGEPLPADWAVHGTSGYDFLNVINGLFVDVANAPIFTKRYNDCVKSDQTFEELAYEKKRLILQISLASELQMLAHQLDRLAQSDRHSRDFTLSALHDGLREIIACFPVYRSYISDEGVHESERQYIESAIRDAAERNPKMSPAVFDFIRDSLLLRFGGEDLREQQRHFAGKFQQVTAPVTAKGIEDTAFYVYSRLVSLNEVGGSPDHFGHPPEYVHQYLAERQARWPYALSCLSTHDTKRSEDVRARINVLSEIPDQWWSAVSRWSRLNEPHRRRLADLQVPDANEELLLYQTLIGAWPQEPHAAEEYSTFIKRIQAYMEKALREAKVHTSWTNPNSEYDKAVADFVSQVLDEQVNASFLQDFRTFQRRINHFGVLNSLSQTLIRLTAPGAPDTYQGTELFDYSLVDPDNRRAVDYPRRREMLAELKAGVESAGADLPTFLRELVQTREDGSCKLLVTWRTLWARKENPGLFTRGEYVPLEPAGAKADNVFAFARRLDNRMAIVAVPRLITHLVPSVGDLPVGREIWQGTRLNLPKLAPSTRFTNVFTRQTVTAGQIEDRSSIPVADLLSSFPVALLLGSEQ